MRKTLIVFVLAIALAATMSILWLLFGRQLSMFVDRFQTAESSSVAISSLSYEGTGAGGILLINDLHLNLDPASQSEAPHIGTTKDNQLALSFSGKVFSFGTVSQSASGAEEILGTVPQAGDESSISIQHSVLSWIEPFKLQGAMWKRHIYYDVKWKKSSGAQLKMLWRYEQHFHAGSGWGSGFMTRENSTGLVRIDIRLKE